MTLTAIIAAVDSFENPKVIIKFPEKIHKQFCHLENRTDLKPEAVFKQTGQIICVWAVVGRVRTRHRDHSLCGALPSDEGLLDNLMLWGVPRPPAPASPGTHPT